MPITLAHLAQLEERSPLRKYIMLNMLREVRLLELLPWENVSALRNLVIRWRTLPPGGGFRRINAGYTQQGMGAHEQVWESVFIFGWDMQNDRIWKFIGNTVKDPVREQIDMKSVAAAINLNNYLINGDHATDPDGFEGIRKRMTLMPARQTIRFAGTGAAAPLDPTASVANARRYLYTLDTAKRFTNKGQMNAWICNEIALLGLARVLVFAQVSGGALLDVTKDSFARDFVTYRGAPIVDVGLLGDQATEIITNVEVADDAGADSTSMFSLAFNDQQGITGIQLAPLDVYDPLSGGELATMPSTMTRCEWYPGLASFGSYGMVQARNLADPNGWT